MLYELLEAVAPVRASGGVVRNGADVVLTGLFSWMLGPRGPLVFMALVIGGAVWLIVRDRRGGPVRASTLAAMLGEAVVLALLFGIVVGTVTTQLVRPLRALAASGGLDGNVLARLTLSLGAGLYEELLFRVVIVALLANGFRLLFGVSRVAAGVGATVIGALLFSAFHYVGPLGEPMRLESFVFRALAGLAFSGLYLTRGFGITAWTHALYDVAVLL
ncbi:MAG TPA: CPBP family glutamic-type intramembrane protease [Gemmatimonadaceae bacterium]|nr:CPBP family glutamic-type intramembrane protease [Gemmatimonadaceae bacterium]